MEKIFVRHKKYECGERLENPTYSISGTGVDIKNRGNLSWLYGPASNPLLCGTEEDWKAVGVELIYC